TSIQFQSALRSAGQLPAHDYWYCDSWARGPAASNRLCSLPGVGGGGLSRPVEKRPRSSIVPMGIRHLTALACRFGYDPGPELVLESELSPLMLTMIEWWRMRSSIATVSTPSPAKAVSQLPKVRFEVRIIEP